MNHHASVAAQETAATIIKMEVSSEAFMQNEAIPRRYTCQGENVNPSLKIENVPKGAMSMALIVDDPDAPSGTWVHWVMWNVPVTNHIKEHRAPGLQGMNDFGKHVYSGPCPPKGTHRYFFKVYALDCKLELPVSSNKNDLEKAMKNHILAFGELTGTYKKS